MKKYIGITIGPIFETINMSSTPSALWLGSFCFSSISREILKRIDSENIISPYYEEMQVDEVFKKGIGVLPDRIILKASDSTNLQSVKALVFDDNGALATVAQQFEIDFDLFKKYIMVQIVEYEAENPILESDKYLSSLELAKKFVPKSSGKNAILSALDNSKGLLIKNQIESALIKDDKLVSIPQIANVKIDNSKRAFGNKHKSYIAIVRSDGDNMSKIISGLNDDASFKAFSKSCFEYCVEISRLVNDEYNGVTIYSSGDDLLAMIPCVSSSGKTIFEFVKDANDKFAKTFSNYNSDVSLSFGITIAYEKFPLYEALENSQNMLFTRAKKDGNKNCLAINLQKHSGQSSALLIKNNALDSFVNLQNFILNSLGKDSDEILLSSLYKISKFGLMLDSASSDNIKNLFVNFFDSSSHTDNDFLHSTLPNFFNSNKEKGNIINLNDNGIVNNVFDSIALSSSLRIIKFFVENGV